MRQSKTIGTRERVLLWEYHVATWHGLSAVVCSPAPAPRTVRRHATALRDFRWLASPYAGATALKRFMEQHGGLPLEFTEAGHRLDANPKATAFLAQPRRLAIRRPVPERPREIEVLIESTGGTEADHVTAYFAPARAEVEFPSVPHLPAVYRPYAAAADAILRLARAAAGESIKDPGRHRAALARLHPAIGGLSDHLACQAGIEWWLACGAVRVSFNWPRPGPPQLTVRAASLWAELGLELARAVARVRRWKFCRKCDDFFSVTAARGGRPSAYCPDCLKQLTPRERQRMNERAYRTRARE
jgi:hypothetical protein